LVFPNVLLPRVKGVSVKYVVGRKPYHHPVAMPILVKVCLYKRTFTISLTYYQFWLVLTLPTSSTIHVWLWYVTAVQKKCCLSLKRLKLHFAVYVYMCISMYNIYIYIFMFHCSL
jgi:hypothetical protein